MHDKDLEIYNLIARLEEKINNLINSTERQEQELTLLRNEFELVKNEGCWLSKQNPDHVHGDFKHE
jgi:hypothetical protein